MKLSGNPKSYSEKTNELLSSLTQIEKDIFSRIIGIEKDKIYMSRPVGASDEIVQVIKENIKL